MPPTPPARFRDTCIRLGLSLGLSLSLSLGGTGCVDYSWPDDPSLPSLPSTGSPSTPGSRPPKPPADPATDPSTPARGGFVVVTGDDADDESHCEGTRCGGLYPSLFREALSRSRSGGKGILAIGVNGKQALETFDSWNLLANGGPGALVKHVRSTEDISRVDFSLYAFVYLPSSQEHTEGGLTAKQIGALNERQAALATFVNERGGSLIALTQAGVEGGWGFLPLPLTTEDTEFDVAEPTEELQLFAPSLTAGELSHKSFHNVFTGPSGYSGLRVLAFNDEVYHPNKGQPVMLGGSSIVLSAEDCADGRDNDGDGDVDGADSDCQVCGNGRVDPGEQCDDGNTVDGDGCGATCGLENRAPEVTCRNATVCTDPGVCFAVSPPGLAVATDPDGDEISWETHPLGPYAPGVHGLCITASDGQKIDSCWSNMTVRDCEAPRLSCPADIQVECAADGKTPVTAPEASAQDNCGSVQVTRPEVGELPLGTQSLVYSATDASGNTATCTTKVKVVDSKPPTVSCPAPIIAECTGRNSAYVTPGGALAADSCSTATLSAPEADFYPLGTHTMRYTARDVSGNEASCTSTIQVVDQTPPAVDVTPPAPLWPVDQKYRTLRLEDCITVYDRCGGGLTQTGSTGGITCVSSDEPSSDTDPDVVFVDATTVKVRVDRQSQGDGRVYSLHFEVRDAAGNVTRGLCPVGVPLEMGGAPVKDSGEQWRTCREAAPAFSGKPLVTHAR
ncbi:MAG: HYR domain-containing protein [Cystobacter sp.]